MPNLQYDIFYVSAARSENLTRNISDYLNGLDENGLLDENLFMRLSTAVAILSSPIMNRGHKNGLREYGENFIAFLNSDELCLQQRILGKTIMLDVFYARNDHANAKRLFYQADGSFDQDFLKLVKEQAEKFYSIAKDIIGFKLVTANDLQFNLIVTEESHVRNKYLALSEKANRILDGVIYEMRPPMSNTFRKRIKELQKYFAFMSTGLDNIKNKWPTTSLEGRIISVPVGTPNYS